MGDFLTSARARAPFYRNSLSTTDPEGQLIEAFRKAKEALVKALPAGTVFDSEKALLSQQMLNQQIEARSASMQAAIDANEDMPEGSQLQMTTEESRQFYLGKYLNAATGIGAYASGIGRHAVEAGTLDKQEYLNGIESRIIAFSDIIQLGETGQLPILVNGESVADKTVASPGSTKPASGSIVLATPGTSFIANPKGASGLGVLWSLPVWAVVVIAVAFVAGICWVVYKWKQIDASTNAMLELCKKAMERGDDASYKLCRDFQEEATSGGALTDLFGKEGQSQLVKYLAIGAGIYLLVVLMPSITQSFMTTQDVVARKQAERRLLAQSNRRR